MFPEPEIQLASRRRAVPGDHDAHRQRLRGRHHRRARCSCSTSRAADQVVRAGLTAPYGGYQVTAGVFNLADESGAPLGRRAGRRAGRDRRRQLRHAGRPARRPGSTAGPCPVPGRLARPGPLPALLRDRPAGRAASSPRRPVRRADHRRPDRDVPGRGDQVRRPLTGPRVSSPLDPEPAGGVGAVGVLGLVRVADRDQGQPVRGRDGDLAGALPQGQQRRPASPARAGRRRRSASRRPGCAPSPGRTRRPARWPRRPRPARGASPAG